MFGTISGHNSKDITEVKHFFGGYMEDGEKKEQREEKEREQIQMERGGKSG